MTFPSKFDDIKVSTHAFVVPTNNLEVDLEKMFELLPVPNITIPSHLKKRDAIEDFIFSLGLEPGTFLRLEYKQNIRGISSLKRVKKKSVRSVCVACSSYINSSSLNTCNTCSTRSFCSTCGSCVTCNPDSSCNSCNTCRACKHCHVKQKYFRNAVTIVMTIPSKLVNFKVPRKGKIQITGCKSEDNAIQCIQLFWDALRKLGSSCYTLPSGSLEATLRMVMTNKNFKCGFFINREKLDKYINMHTHFRSLLELSVGYTGANIKLPFSQKNIPLTTLTCDQNGNWNKGSILYHDYLDTLSVKDRKKEEETRYNSFLVFHSGTAIMSGMMPEYMKDAYNQFTSIIHEARDCIEEKLVQPTF